MVKKIVEKYLEKREKKDIIEKDRKDGTGKTRGKNSPSIEKSGGFCLHESKVVRTVVDRRTGIKKVFINDIEFMERL